MTLQSVLRQEFKDFEVVIVDDASSDRTIAILENFDDPRIRLSKNERNLGMGENWNKVVSRARGKYVKLLCGDDLLHPHCLERQVSALESAANSKAVLAICGREVINSRGNVVLRRKLPFRSGLVAGKEMVQNSVRWGSNLIGEPAVGLFRREILAKNVTYDPSNPYLIDLGFWAELLRYGDAFVDRDCLASFRISENAVSATIGFGQAASYRTFLRAMRDDPFYRVTSLDRVLGSILSFQWCIVRNLFLKFHSRQGHHEKITTQISVPFPAPRQSLQMGSREGTARHEMARPRSLC